MKKTFLAIFVVATFIIYSVRQHQEGSSTVVAPVTTSSNSAPASTTSASSVTSLYKDGQYTGSVADAYYGYIQVAVTISGGKITDVKFLQHPNDRSTSVRINEQAMPYLTQEAIQAQNANVDIVSGATDSSQAFIESLTSALHSAKS